MNKKILPLFLILLLSISSSSFKGAVKSRTHTLARGKKIAKYQQRLFVVEPNTGFHVYDLKDKLNPKYEGFVAVKGLYDVAVRNNMAYANSGANLLTIKLADDMRKLKKAFTTKMVFKENFNSRDLNSKVTFYPAPGYGDEPASPFSGESDEPIAASDETRKAGFFARVKRKISGTSVYKSSGVSIQGSYSCFSIYGSYLYAIDYKGLKVFSLSEGGKPKKIGTKELPSDIETITTSCDKAFVATRTGMFVFDIKNPKDPKETRCEFRRHRPSRDPVAATHEFAFATLMDVNTLAVTDLRNFPRLQQRNAYEIRRPEGIAVDADHKRLLVAGDNRLTLLAFDNQGRIRKLNDERCSSAKDVIFDSRNKEVIILAGNQIHIFDFESLMNTGSFRKLSQFTF